MARNENKKKVSFEQSLQRLTEIVTELETGELSLDDSLGRYEEGRLLLRQCYELLESAERRIEALLEGEDGKLEIKPFESPEDAGRQEGER